MPGASGRVATHLPIGISFFTFHAISYLVDVHRERRQTAAQPDDFALYITMFPQLIAGPIIRYHDISDSSTTHRRRSDSSRPACAVSCIGLGKKVLIANTLVAAGRRDLRAAIDELTAARRSPGSASSATRCRSTSISPATRTWRSVSACMFGFRFLENFDFPYVARSLTEFWRRWHISLSAWFRDYLYIPLGGNRAARAHVRQSRDRVLLVRPVARRELELRRVGPLSRVLPGARTERARRMAHAPPTLLGRVYFLPFAVVGWVFFRCDTLSHAVTHLSVMAGLQSGSGEAVPLLHYLQNDVLLAVAVGVVGSAPVVPWLARKRARLLEARGWGATALYATWEAAAVLAMATVFVASAAMLASGTYNPFIYFRF